VKVKQRRPDGDAPLSQKVVSGKEPKTTLLAHDGSRCQVTERRYNEITTGEKVWCVWR
jgi:hypothetical protein